MTDMTDPRLERLVSIDGTAHRKRLVIAVQTGGPESRLNTTVRDLARVASRFRATAAEVRNASNMLDSERGARIGEAAAPLVQTLKQSFKVYAEEHSRIQHLAQTASAVPPYGATTPWYVANEDSELIAKFNAMQPTAQKILVHHCTHDTKDYLRWAQALLRKSPELSGLTADEHDAMRRGALLALDPASYAAVDNELEQAEQAQHALQLAAQVLSEDSPGTLTELRASSPEFTQALLAA
jgi:hypothetical protein